MSVLLFHPPPIFQGCYILTKPRPVDQFESLLEQHKTGDCEPVEAFFHLHGESQACSMCLILAAGHNKEASVCIHKHTHTNTIFICRYLNGLLRLISNMVVNRTSFFPLRLDQIN